MGIIHQPRLWVDLTFSLDTSAYAIGDLLADVQELASGWPTSQFTGNYPLKLQTMIIRDEDDQAAADMDVIFTRTSTSLGTENNAYAPSDALGRDIVNVIRIDAMDWVDIGGSKQAVFNNLQSLMMPSATGSLYVALVTYGSPTQSASGIKGSFGFE